MVLLRGFFVFVANLEILSTSALCGQAHRLNPLPVEVSQTLAAQRMSLLSHVRFVGWA